MQDRASRGKPPRLDGNPASADAPTDPAAGRTTGGGRICSALEPSARNEHYLLDVDPVCKFVLFRRTEVPFERLADIDACFDELERALANVAREEYSVLIDVRRGPARNDQGFETAMQKNRRKIELGFRRYAFLASTAVGRLQLQRMVTTNNPSFVGVTHEPSAALLSLGLPEHHW
jgi:hypothetical protein